MAETSALARERPVTKFVTTAELPVSERFDYWREVVCSTFLGVDCQKVSEHAFSGEITSTRINGFGFSRVRNQGYKCLRTARRAATQDGDNVVFVTLVTRGATVLVQDDRETKLDPGDFTCIDSSRPYAGMKSDDCELLVLDMPRSVWTGRIGSTEPITARAIRGHTYVGGLVSNFLRQTVTGIEQVDPMTAGRLADVSLALMATAVGDLVAQQGEAQHRSTGRIALLYRAYALIDQHLDDCGLNPERIARALGISERYLQQLFHEEKTTVSNWLWQRRLQRCRRELADELLAHKSVSEIAYGCGFSDLTHFGRRFKAAYEVTPSEFRRERLRLDRDIVTGR